MTERRPEDIRRAIDGELSGVGRDPFLYQRILNSKREETPRRRPRKLTVALVALAVLMLSTAAAVATNWLGVKYFLTERLALPVPVEDAYVVQPVSQSFDSERLSMRATDAYWYATHSDDRLDITLHADVQDPEKAFCMDTDIGTDGENFDMIWWHGDILPVADWLAGREGYKLYMTLSLQIGGQSYWGSLDWVHEEQGMTMLIEVMDAPDLSKGATVTVQGWSYPIVPDDGELGHLTLHDDMERFTLTFDLPPMTKGPAPVFDDWNEPNA